jgi:outer membrane receptor protein involved in Fe transport
LISTRRISSDSAAQVLFNQDGSSQFRRQGYQAGLGFDWTPNEKNDITARINLDGFGNKSNGTIQQSQLTADKTNPSNIYSSIATSNYTRNKFGNHENGAELNYKKHFAREDQELEIGVTTSFGPMHISSGSNQLLQPMDSLIYGTSGTNKGNERQTEITLDYSQPFSDDIKLNVGGKLIFYGISSNSDVLRLQTGSNTYALDTSLSNSLDYKQRVYAMYAELNFPVFQLFSAKLGTRYERTNNHAFFSNAGQPVNTPGYDTWVPSIFVMRKLSEKQTLKLSYSKRIERPDYTDLNPFVNTSDPKNISAGNPNLKPEINNRYELGYNLDLGKGGSFVVTVFYRENHNDIQPFIVYYPLYKIGDSTYTNVSVTTRRNIGLEKNMGLSLFGDLRLATKFSLRSNLFAFYRHTFNAIDKGYNSRSVNYRFNVNASYQFSNSFAGEFFGNFSSARHEAQGKYPSFTSYSFAVRKQFWNNKGSLALTAVNPFNLYVRQETNLFGPGFNLISTRRIPFRSFGINFTWKFGKLVFKKDEEGNKDNNNLNAPAEN